MTTKKIFIIAAILLGLIGLTLFVYNIFFKAKPSSENPEATSSLSPSTSQTVTPAPGNQSNQKTTPRILPISQERAFGATIGIDGKTVKYFSQATGQIFESAFDGTNLKKISSVTLSGLIKALWSPDKDKVIGIFSENNQTKKYFYNYSNGQSSLLNNNVGYVAWSPDGKNIAYQFSSAATEQSTISISDPDGSNWKNIFKTRLANLIVEWPSKEKISIRTQVSGLAQGLLYVIDSATGDFNKILSDLYGLNIRWSPKADKILYSKTTNYGHNPSLTLADDKGANSQDLKISGIIDKCVWSKDDRTVFCAIPQIISPDATWPDDYYKGLLILADDFYKINLETGEKTMVATSNTQTSYDAQDLFLSPKEDYLFFINRVDGLLYSLRI